MHATWRVYGQRSPAAWHQRQFSVKVDTRLSWSSAAGVARFRPNETSARDPARSANACQYRDPFRAAKIDRAMAIFRP